MIIRSLIMLISAFGLSQSAFSQDSRACHDPALGTCLEAVGEDVSLECEPEQEPMEMCADGQLGTCTWEAATPYEVQWRFYDGSPILDQGPAYCAESGGTWSAN